MVAQYIAMPIHYSSWKFHEHGNHAGKCNIFDAHDDRVFFLNIILFNMYFVH